eukprot:gene2965-4975_t
MSWCLLIIIGIFISRIISTIWYNHIEKLLYPEYIKQQQELAFLSKEVKKYNSIDLFTTKSKIERQMIKREQFLSEENSKTSHKLKFFLKIIFYVVLRFGFSIFCLYYLWFSEIFHFDSSWCLKLISNSSCLKKGYNIGIFNYLLFAHVFVSFLPSHIF